MLAYLLSFVIGSQYNLLPPPSSWSASRARIIEYALCPYFSRKMLREVFALASFPVKRRASSHACASSSGTRCSYVLPVCVNIHLCVYIHAYITSHTHTLSHTHVHAHVDTHTHTSTGLPLTSWSAPRARIIEYALCPYFSWKMLREAFALAAFTVKIRASSHACASSSGTRCSYVLPVCVCIYV